MLILNKFWMKCTEAGEIRGHSSGGSGPVRLLRSSESELTAPVEESGDFPSHLS